jgi:broad specificity phosphatase PhoE
MAYAIYISHPEVVIDPAVATPQWGLSEKGFARARAFAARHSLPAVAKIFSSTERKALDLAGVLAEPSGLEIAADEAFGENDRSSTGFLTPELFEATADRFFAEPETGPDGWESANDAQARIVAAVRQALDTLPSGRLAVFTGHGAVGTLLKCHCASRTIARSEDQRRIAHPGGGNVFVFSTDLSAIACDWTAMEDFDPASYGLL